MKILIYSFSRKYPDHHHLLPDNPNFVFDCRGIKNPGRVETLKRQTGLDADVIAFLEGNEDATQFFDNLMGIIAKSAASFLDKGYKQMAVGFCCTGGRHRSVYFTEKLAAALAGARDVDIEIRHLDIKSDHGL